MRKNIFVFILLCIGLVAQGMSQSSARLQPPADPLEPWGLEPVPRVARPDPETAVPLPPASDSLEVSFESLPHSKTDSLLQDEPIVLVNCRQVLIPGPNKASRLHALLRQGMPYERAINLLKITDADSRLRSYALDDLAADVQAEIAVLPDSGWSTPRSWKGRTLFFQILSRADTLRSALPALGQGLGREEERLVASNLQRLRTKTRRRATASEAAPVESFRLVPAKVVEQAPAEYPVGAFGDGTVELKVDVGRLDQVLKVHVVSATSPEFEAAAIEAAKASTYQAARRGGVAEPGQVPMTFYFTSSEDSEDGES